MVPVKIEKINQKTTKVFLVKDPTKFIFHHSGIDTRLLMAPGEYFLVLYSPLHDSGDLFHIVSALTAQEASDTLSALMPFMTQFTTIYGLEEGAFFKVISYKENEKDSMLLETLTIGPNSLEDVLFKNKKGMQLKCVTMQ